MTNIREMVRSPSGAISAAVLAALAGFAAGALLVGAVTSDGGSVVAGERIVAPAFSGTLHESVPLAATIEGGKDWPADPQPLSWSFEAKAAASTGSTGPKRSDRLSGPEGWTYDSSAPTVGH